MRHRGEEPWEGSSIVGQYYVCIMGSYKETLYTGVTNNLVRRVYEHRHKLLPGFTNECNVSRFVFREETESLDSARAREKEIIGVAQKQESEIDRGVGSVLV